MLVILGFPTGSGMLKGAKDVNSKCACLSGMRREVRVWSVALHLSARLIFSPIIDRHHDFALPHRAFAFALPNHAYRPAFPERV